MYEPTAAERNRHMRHAPVLAIRKEREVGRPELEERSGFTARLRLLPRVARHCDAVETEDRLRESGAVGAPGRDSSPEVRRSLEEILRRANDRDRVARKCPLEIRLIHGVAARHDFLG